LAINGYTNPLSEQPIELEDCVLICNGEIYNWKYLHRSLNIPTNTGSDCEIIIHLYKKFGIEYTVNILDGVFAFLLLDKNSNKVFVSRDPYGVRPLFCSYTKANESHFHYIFSSELKMMTHMITDQIYKAEQFTPGSYMEINMDNGKQITKQYFNSVCATIPAYFPTEYYHMCIKNALMAAVNKRVNNTDREVACLLSGGLDSSLITALVAEALPDPSILKTFSIGMEGS